MITISTSYYLLLPAIPYLRMGQEKYEPLKTIELIQLTYFHSRLAIICKYLIVIN